MHYTHAHPSSHAHRHTPTAATATNLHVASASNKHRCHCHRPITSQYACASFGRPTHPTHPLSPRYQYCETTDLSTWALVFGWVNMSIVTWQFLVQVWFWQINWKYFATGGEEAQKKSLKRLKLLKQLPQPAAMFQIGMLTSRVEPRTSTP